MRFHENVKDAGIGFELELELGFLTFCAFDQKKFESQLHISTQLSFANKLETKSKTVLSMRWAATIWSCHSQYRTKKKKHGKSNTNTTSFDIFGPTHTVKSHGVAA